MYDLRISEKAAPVRDAVKEFVAHRAEPVTEEFYALVGADGDRWRLTARQTEILEGLKREARDRGLWNLFLPGAVGGGLSNLDYAYLAEEMGRNPLASECFNCSAPDTGNMEILHRFGTPEQKQQWLRPLLDGEIRSCYAMTEPGVASSDARNIATRAVLDGDHWVIEGEKFFVSGAGDARCRLMICMVRTHPDAEPYRQQSQILVPMDTPGVEVVGPMNVFGQDGAPHGHMHLRLRGVRVPRANVLLGEGCGFEISQARLGPGRIHHCMRAIGEAERALDLMCRRGLARQAFGAPLARLGKNLELVSRSRIEIESMRLLVLRAARAMDVEGNKEARVWIHAVKATVPVTVCEIIDRAIQIHGAAGLSQWTPLASMYLSMRGLRIADGPEEVHHLVVGRAELARHR